MTVMVFPWSGGAPHTVLTNEITHADFSLEPGKYHVLVFNQSTTEFGTLDFLGMDSYEMARAVVLHTTSRWYSRGDNELIGVEPEWLASDKLDEFDVFGDSSEVTLTPRNVLSLIQVNVKVPSIGYLCSARGSLTGISEGPSICRILLLLQVLLQVFENHLKKSRILNGSLVIIS